MGSEIILSILTPAVPSRLEQVGQLIKKLEYQIWRFGDGAKIQYPVEHLVLLDNKKRTVGEKRDALLVAARGRYVAFVDDDDDISGDYVESLLLAAQSNPDVITFQQEAIVNAKHAIVEFKLGNPNDPFYGEPKHCTIPLIRRNAWHVCAWRRTLAILSHFPASNYGEDWAFAAPLCAMPNLREVHIDKVLHYYRHSSETTEAPPPLTAAKN
jgi:glycosyltransferase involved in cell wall biosynthesis